jgi:C-terminal processing protease CtpA/Prc
MQHQIRIIDNQKPCGWIVDLRGNTGGNMWPMLIGIGPVLGKGLAGSFIDADGNQVDWAYLDGKGLLGDEVISQVNGAPYQIANPEAPVAVLFGEGTASSGEVIVISFIGRPNTRTFGGSSAGYTTGNDEFELSDGAYIFLTTVIDADRTGKVYRSVIVPDVRVDGNNYIPGPIPAEALQWLREQPACAGDK